MSQVEAITIRVDKSDKELLDLCAKIEGRSVASIVTWAARLYAMALVADSFPSLQDASRKFLEKRLSPDAVEEVRYRFTQDIDRYNRFLQYIGAREPEAKASQEFQKEQQDGQK